MALRKEERPARAAQGSVASWSRVGWCGGEAVERVRAGMGRRGCGALAALLVALSSCAHAAVQLTGFGATPGPSGAGAATQPKPSSAAPKPAAVPAPDATSDTVGATVASFRVDAGGNATYSIPIQLP